MGFVLSTTGLTRLITAAVASGDTNLRAAVIATGGSITDAAIEDADTVSNIIGVSSETEVTNTNYARQTLTSVTVTKDETNNWVEITAAAPTINSVAAGSVWRRVLYYWNIGTEGSAGDASHVPLGVDTPTSTLTPNGGNVTLPTLIVRVNDTSA
jgi:predicted dehydrogenase